MKSVIVGAHLHRDDIEPLATAIAVSDLFLSGVEVEDDQPLGDRALLIRVAETRARLLERATFIAVRYGFAARSAAEALGKCAEFIDRWRDKLNAHRDEVEMTLKVAATGSMARPNREDFTAGAAYLRALHAASRSAHIDDLFREAVSAMGAHRWLNRHDGALECALLVPRGGIGEVIARGEQLKRDFPETPFLLSGPWPLEVFADDHE